MTTVHIVKQGKHCLAIRNDPGHAPQVHTVLYNTTPARAHTILSKRRNLLVH